jgi:hypothetical protein
VPAAAVRNRQFEPVIVTLCPAGIFGSHSVRAISRSSWRNAAQHEQDFIVIVGTVKKSIETI